ncbi:MAG TPA: twin-arginine translocation signal domain-containing protein, partial [Bacteroidales bacterium]|nr:twin-arginine translocation signal domain-containing protein [Bacteroidales bacterium]
MKNIIKDIQKQNPMMEKTESTAKPESLKQTGTSRRDFIRKGALGGIALGGLMHLSVEDTIAQTTAQVNRASNPSDLKITDM